MRKLFGLTIGEFAIVFGALLVCEGFVVFSYIHIFVK